jgi:hypothetical protein
MISWTAGAACLSWNTPTTTEYCLGDTPAATASWGCPPGDPPPNITYSYSWTGAKPCSAGEYTITATETVSSETITLTVYVNGVTGVSHPHPAIPTAYAETFTATMSPHEKGSCIRWSAVPSGSISGSGISVTASWSSKQVGAVVYAKVGDATPGATCAAEVSASSSVDVVVVTNLNVALFPTDRKRYTVGVYEETWLGTDPAHSADWTATDGDVTTPGSLVLFTAPGTETSVTVTWALFAGAERTVSFNVKVPNGVYMEVNGTTKHKEDWTSAGFCGKWRVLPIDVSFEGLCIGEDSVAASVTSGDWVGMDDHTAHFAWTVLTGNWGSSLDNIWASWEGVHPGGFTWVIPWRWAQAAAGGTVFTSLNQVFSASAIGTAEITKGNEGATSGPKLIGAATDWDECAY